MISRRNFLKKTGLVAASTPFIGKLASLLPTPVEAAELSPPGTKYHLAFPRNQIQGNFTSSVVSREGASNNIFVDIRKQRIHLHKRMQYRDFYIVLQDRFDIDPTLFDEDVPLYSVTPYSFCFNKGWDFANDRSRKMIIGGAWDNYANIYTLGHSGKGKYKVYYRYGYGRWKKFTFHANDDGVINEAIEVKPDTHTEFILVDEKRAIILDSYCIDKVHHRCTYAVPLFAWEPSPFPVKRYAWNRKMCVYDAKIQLNELWIKDLS